MDILLQRNFSKDLNLLKVSLSCLKYTSITDSTKFPSRYCFYFSPFFSSLKDRYGSRDLSHAWSTLRKKRRRDTTADRSVEQLFNEPARTCIVSGTRSPTRNSLLHHLFFLLHRSSLCSGVLHHLRLPFLTGILERRTREPLTRESVSPVFLVR